MKVTAVERTGSDSSHDSDVYSYSDKKDRRKPVEIQVSGIIGLINVELRNVFAHLTYSTTAKENIVRQPACT